MDADPFQILHHSNTPYADTRSRASHGVRPPCVRVQVCRIYCVLVRGCRHFLGTLEYCGLFLLAALAGQIPNPSSPLCSSAILFQSPLPSLSPGSRHQCDQDANTTSGRWTESGVFPLTSTLSLACLIQVSPGVGEGRMGRMDSVSRASSSFLFLPTHLLLSEVAHFCFLSSSPCDAMRWMQPVPTNHSRSEQQSEGPAQSIPLVQHQPHWQVYAVYEYQYQYSIPVRTVCCHSRTLYGASYSYTLPPSSFYTANPGRLIILCWSHRLLVLSVLSGRERRPSNTVSSCMSPTHNSDTTLSQTHTHTHTTGLAGDPCPRGITVSWHGSNSQHCICILHFGGEPRQEKTGAGQEKVPLRYGACLLSLCLSQRTMLLERSTRQVVCRKRPGHALLSYESELFSPSLLPTAYTLWSCMQNTTYVDLQRHGHTS